MKKKITGFSLLYLISSLVCFSQVDTSYIYKTNTPFGSLDIRIAKSATNYYYLKEGETFSFRESTPGVRTNTFRDMTSWDSGPYSQGHLREKTDGGDNFVMNYRLLVPDGYDPTFPEGYPLVIMMHGYGERGNCEGNRCYHANRAWSPNTNNPPAPTNDDNELLNNDHNLLHGGGKHLAAVKAAGTRLPNDPSLEEKALPGFVLFPQNMNGWDHFAVQDAIRLIRLLMKKYNIDPDRVHIEGLSNGGHGLYEALKRAPWLFASGIAMSAVDDGFINTQKIAHTVAHIPLWIFQGGMDVNPLPTKTVRYIQQFRSAGADIRYTFYPGLGHGTWNKAFNEPDFFSWMMGKNKADIHSFEGSTFICSEEGTRLELAKGFMAYQWEFNGQVIAGADSAVFYAKTPGSYRARFSRVSNPSEAQWNQWSNPLELTAADPPQANIQQIGTTHLKDLNGSANARLQSAESHAHYYWYKNGSLLNLPGNEDDTLQVATIAPSFGNGVYTLAVADYGCRSEVSSPKYVFFNDSAPVNLDAPTDFTGVSTAPDENVLSWTDASTGEIGFEIWRRRKVNATKWGPWEMAGLAGANATTFDDVGLDPLMSYQYKIRAISSTGRSGYTPSDPNTGIVVETITDTEPPAAPAELTATPAGVEQFRLAWKASTDNTRIREYYVYYNGDSVATASTDTSFLLTNLELNTEYEITVKGVDLLHNLSPASNTAEASTYLSGLFYEHTTGSWPELDSIDWSWAEFTGKVSRFTLSPKTQDDYYNMSFDGYLLITEGGDYSFRTTSSDGSKLWIDDQLLVNNDGIHDVTSVSSGPTSLAEGPHRIYVQFFEYTGTDSLSVQYSGPDTGNEWVDIPSEVLKSDESIVTGIGEDDGPEDSFIVSVYPNPTTQNNIRVMVETIVPAPVRVRLLDLRGSNLFDAVFQPDEIISGVNISPAGNLSNGMYLVSVEQGSVVVREKVILRD